MQHETHTPSTEPTTKNVIVTGATRGIGAEISQTLMRAGYRVIGTYVSEHSASVAEKLASAAAAASHLAEYHRVDSADPEAVEAFVGELGSKYGSLYGLVNNAAISDYRPVGEFGIADVERTLDTNVLGPYIFSQAAAAHMTDEGRIVNIGSTVATRMARRTGSLYATSKAALIGMTKGMARDLGPRGITVNMVNPGPVATEMLDPALHETMLSFLALERLGRPADIAAVVEFVVEDRASFVTGALIPVDGGYTI